MRTLTQNAPASTSKSRPLDAARETAVLGTLLAECPEELPTHCRRLLEHAPESFDDLRHGTIAVAIRQLRAAGKPVAPLTVREQLNSRLDDAGGDQLLDSLTAQAVTVDLAEYEAGPLWQAYQLRRTKAALSDAAAALESSPAHAGTIIATAISTLESLTEKQSNDASLTIRQPDALLSITFDESDRILGDRLLATGQSLVLAGPGAIGKSRLLLQLAVATITGRQFLGFETRRDDLRWLILQAENSNRRLQTDLAALRAWVGDDWPRVNQQLYIHTLEADADCLLSLDNPDAQRRIADTIRQLDPGIVCYDSLYNFGIGDLNRDEDMGATLLTLARLSKAGNPNRSTVTLHHSLTGRTGASRATGYDRASFGRNSKVLHSWTRGQMNVAPGSPDSNDVLVLSCGKCSNGKEFAPFAARLNPCTMIYEVAPDFDVGAWQAEVSGSRDREPIMTPERVRELCAVAGMDKAELAKAITEDCGCYRGSAYRYIAKATKARTINERKSDGRYFRK